MGKVCPLMSDAKSRVLCIGEDCEFWVEVENREGEDCAIVNIAYDLDSIRYIVNNSQIL